MGVIDELDGVLAIIFCHHYEGGQKVCLEVRRVEVCFSETTESGTIFFELMREASVLHRHWSQAPVSGGGVEFCLKDGCIEVI